MERAWRVRARARRLGTRNIAAVGHTGTRIHASLALTRSSLRMLALELTAMPMTMEPALLLAQEPTMPLHFVLLLLLRGDSYPLNLTT